MPDTAFVFNIHALNRLAGTMTALLESTAGNIQSQTSGANVAQTVTIAAVANQRTHLRAIFATFS